MIFLYENIYYHCKEKRWNVWHWEINRIQTVYMYIAYIFHKQQNRLYIITFAMEHLNIYFID